MRNAAAIAILLMLPMASRAVAQYDYGGATGFSLERWDEDYSYLKNPSDRKDFFDPIKYIPLTRDGETYISFGGQARYRFDYFNNRDFGQAAFNNTKGADDEDGFHLQ